MSISQYGTQAASADDMLKRKAEMDTGINEERDLFDIIFDDNFNQTDRRLTYSSEQRLELLKYAFDKSINSGLDLSAVKFPVYGYSLLHAVLASEQTDSKIGLISHHNDFDFTKKALEILLEASPQSASTRDNNENIMKSSSGESVTPSYLLKNSGFKQEEKEKLTKMIEAAKGKLSQEGIGKTGDTPSSSVHAVEVTNNGQNIKFEDTKTKDNPGDKSFWRRLLGAKSTGQGIER